METTVRKEIEALRHMTVSQLKKKYAEVFGDGPGRSGTAGPDVREFQEKLGN